MDKAIANPATQTLVPDNGAFGRLAAMPAKSKMMLGMAIAALAAVVVGLSLWSSQGDFKVLYPNLSEKDGGAVIAALSTMNIPFRTVDGGTIMVPADKVAELKMKLATAGLPKGTVVGNELLDNAKFGQTDRQERMNIQRALEGELTRSITQLSAVSDARVHLALPNQNGFFREEQKPSASVLLTLHGGRSLDRAQIAGIVHLIASSVPELSPKAVSVIDQTGALLSDTESTSGAGLDANQLRYVNEIEASLQKRIVDMLEPVVGRDNLRATVTADVDFAQTESTQQEVKPNTDPATATIVNQSSTDSNNGAGAAGAGGIAGAVSNQPPTAATAPLAGASQPLQAAGGANGGAGAGGNSRKDRSTTYDIDKLVRVTRGATGQVRHLNAAVVVNNHVVTNDKGKTTTTPLTKEELDKMTALVEESIGFSKDRGDSVKVINETFKVEAEPKAEEVPIFKQPWLIDLVRAAAVPTALAVVAMVVMFSLIKPALRASAAEAEARTQALLKGSQVDTMVDDDGNVINNGSGNGNGGANGGNGNGNGGANGRTGPGGVPALEAPKITAQLAGARSMAKDNPAAVANIVRGWVSGDSAV